jgi:hypothetical protein
VQVCGDAHLSNFGIFGSAERNLVFDVNDFDETLSGPWEWDAKRLAANLDVWYAHADMDELRAQLDSQLKQQQRKAVDKGLAKARTRDSMQEVAKLTRIVDGRPRIISDPPLLVPIEELMPTETDRAGSGIFLGWQRAAAGLDGRTRDLYVRQLRDWKFSVDIETMVPTGLRMYGALCGWTLARARPLRGPDRSRRLGRVRPGRYPIRGGLRGPERA